MDKGAPLRWESCVVLQGLVRRCCLDKYLRPSIDKIISELENLYNIM